MNAARARGFSASTAGLVDAPPPEVASFANVPHPVRVGMVVNNLDVGGLEKVAISLIRRLKEFGHDPHLICLNGAGKMIDQAGLPRDRTLIHEKKPVPMFGLSVDPSLVLAIRRFCTERRLQILHAHNLGPLVYAGLAARTLWDRPKVVYSEHNQIYSAKPGVRRRFAYYIRLADHVVAVSGDLKRELIERVGTRRPVEVIHNGIERMPFDPAARAKVRAALKVEAADILIGTVAVLSRQKGISHLLEAIPKVSGLLPRARFVIVGDGPLRGSLMQQAEDQGLTDRVIFTGYRNDIPRLMEAFDVYAQPSLWEGLPLVLIEALRAGKPIVATRVGGNPEVVEHARNGLLVEPGDSDALADALVRVATDEQFREAVTDRNVEKFQSEFALDAMVTSHIAVYSRLSGRIPT
jgi:glycosyltransferase involved in cell wall biosynthesis